MADMPRIGMLWMEGPLSWLEQLCIVSFRDAGHAVVLYHYGPLDNVPEGIALADAAEVLPRDGGGLTHARTGSPALHSDLFRYRLLAREPGMIWADTDAYCLRPFTTQTGHFHGWESEKHVNGGVLGLPADSATLSALLAFTSDEYAVPPWYDAATRAEYARRAGEGDPVHAGAMGWGVWGPHALTHFLHETGEVRYSFPRHVLYPFTFAERRQMLKRKTEEAAFIRPDTLSVHFYGRRMRKRLVEREGGLPPRGSLIGRLVEKHRIRPEAAPLPVAPVPQEEPPSMPQPTDPTVAPPVPQAPAPQATAPQTAAPAPQTPATAPQTAATAPQTAAPAPQTPAPAAAPGPAADGPVNLTDLADRYGSDKGSRKHRYTELYHMLFHPWRDRALTFLEMGLQIGGPEHGKSEDRATTDAPSIRMWLDYFPKAQIVGLDVSDFSWMAHPRFAFHRCDMDDRANIRAAAAAIPAPDIVIDDASHASAHQQEGFLELFPKLAPGGLYVIEDLRWQPSVYEDQRPGITKTAALFQSWLQKREFQHSDPAMGAEFNALAPMISGCFIFQAHFDKTRRDQVVVVHKR